MNDWNSAFVMATKPLWDSLLRFALSLTHARHDADDLLQTCLLKGLQGFTRFVEANFPGVTKPDEAERTFARPENLNFLRNWLFKILKNTFLDQCAKDKRFAGEEALGPTGLDNSSPEPGWHSRGSPAFNVEAGFTGDVAIAETELALFERDFARAALDDGWKVRLAELTPRQRSVLFLAAEGYAYKEIASILDIPMGTVMSNLSRSLQKLKKSSSGSTGE